MVICWSYYAYFVAVVLTAMSSHITEQIVCGVIFHMVSLMLVWSYYKVVSTHPGQVPATWRLATSDVERLTGAKSEDEWKAVLASLGSQMGCEVKQRSVQKAVRYCEKCVSIKPDRSHHCSVCEVCTLKMDHHCPWVNNCVGFHNYKFFLLFLGYALTYCIFIATSTARHFLQIWLLQMKETSEDNSKGGEEDEEVVVESGESPEDGDHLINYGAAKYHILFVFVVSILFTMSICSLFGYHIWLVLHNRTTLEQFRAPVFENNLTDPRGWSMGKLNNVKEVFGNNYLLWLIPVSTCLGDGLSFPSSVQPDVSDYQSLSSSAGYRPIQTSFIPESPNRTLVNPVLGISRNVDMADTVVNIQGGDVNGHLTELKVER